MAVPEGITTSVVAVGIPPHQLAAVFQSVLEVPIQVPEVHEPEPTVTNLLAGVTGELKKVVLI